MFSELHVLCFCASDVGAAAVEHCADALQPAVPTQPQSPAAVKLGRHLVQPPTPAHPALDAEVGVAGTKLDFTS